MFFSGVNDTNCTMFAPHNPCNDFGVCACVYVLCHSNTALAHISPEPGFRGRTLPLRHNTISASQELLEKRKHPPNMSGGSDAALDMA